MALGQWVGFLALAIALYILWEIRQVLLLVFAAVVFATALNSLVRRLQRSGVKREIAAVGSIALLLLLFILFFALIVPPFTTQFQQLVELVPKGFERVQVWFESMQTNFPWSTKYVPQVDDLIRQAQPLAARLAGNFFSWFSNVLAIVLNLLLVTVLTIMFLLHPQPYRRGLVVLFPAFYRRRADQILNQCEIALVNWIGGILINMLVIGVVSGLGLWILGVPLVLANALLAGLLEAIPNVGPALSVIPPVAIAFLDTPWKAVAVLILYILIQQLEQFFLVPFVMAKQVKLLPAVTLLSQVVFALFFGFLGLFLAIPLVIVGQIWIREVLVRDVLDQWHEKSPGLSHVSPEADEPPLTAIDQEEASESSAN